MSENGNKLAPTYEVNAIQAGYFAALSDPNRVRIIYELAEGPRNVKSLAGALELSSSATSRHLKILRSHHLVRDQRQGHMVEYSLAAPALLDVLSIFLDILHEHFAHRATLVEIEREYEEE